MCVLGAGGGESGAGVWVCTRKRWWGCRHAVLWKAEAQGQQDETAVHLVLDGQGISLGVALCTCCSCDVLCCAVMAVSTRRAHISRCGAD